MLKKMLALTGAAVALTGAAFAGLTSVQLSANTDGATEKKSCCVKPAEGSAEKKSCCKTKGEGEKKACCVKPAADADEATATVQNTAEEVKLTEVRVCPMMNHPVKATAKSHQIVGQHKVYFCCGGCKLAFNKLTPEEQQKRIAEALKTQEAAQAKTNETA